MSVPADAKNVEPVAQQLAQRLCNNRYNPVCGTRRGRRRTFTNFCRARRAGALNIRRGRCRAATCGNQYRPVCGYRAGRWRNFRNACLARRANASSIRAGVCGTPIRTCHQRATSRRYPHIRGRSWSPACRAATTPAPRKVGDRCVGKGGQGIPFNGRLAVGAHGILICLAGGGAR
ncbi:MAG: hypothetical protein ACTSUD_07900 [Alphaproteobacteria bacterium]